MYPIMLPGAIPGLTYNDQTSSARNPDGLASEMYGTPPDPVGRLYLRVLEGIEDRMASIGLPRLNLRVRRRPASHPA